MRQIKVMHGGKCVRQTLQSRSVSAGSVAKQCVDVGLVERQPMLNAVAEPLGHDTHVICKFRARIAIKPSPLLLQDLRKVPMIQTEPWPQTLCKQSIDQPVIKIETAVLDNPGAQRQNARPGS